MIDANNHPLKPQFDDLFEQDEITINEYMENYHMMFCEMIEGDDVLYEIEEDDNRVTIH